LNIDDSRLKIYGFLMIKLAALAASGWAEQQTAE